MKKITSKLAKENVAYDINGYPKAPPSFRIWGGGTVEPEDINLSYYLGLNGLIMK